MTHRLTPAQQHALKQLAHNDHPHPAGSATMNRLRAHGLATRTEKNRWRITPEGRRALAQSHDTPLLLHRKIHRGYTTDPDQAIPGEPEVLHPDDHWTTEARQRHATAHQDTAPTRAQQVAALEQAAANGDRDAQRSLASIDRRVRAHRRKAA